MNKSRFLNDDGRDVFLYADRLSDEEIERLAQLQSSGKIEGRIFSPVSGTPLIVKRHSVELIELGYVKCWFACKPGMATPSQKKRKGHWSCPFCFQVLAEYEGPVEPLRIPIERIPPNLIRPTWKSRHSDKPPQTEGLLTGVSSV